MAISRSRPQGYVYVISGNRPENDRGESVDGIYITKVGCSEKPFQSKGGRCDAPNFWLLALGHGAVNVYADEAHLQAWHVEMALKESLKEWQHTREVCGKSTESFNLPPARVVEVLRPLLSKKYNA